MAETVVVSVLPWGIEAAHPRCSDLLIQSIPGCRLRSAIDGVAPAIDFATGEPRVPQDQARHLGGFPRIGGMEIHVNPGSLTYTIIDPLHGNDQMLERIRRFIKESGMPVSDKLAGVPSQTGTLDTHRMKTLCREMLWILNSKEGRKAKGTVPTMEDIAELPGEFLLNPGMRTGSTQPVYEKDWDEWVAQLSRSGG